jgi:nucleoside-diphosphate-sugar epimerase
MEIYLEFTKRDIINYRLPAVYGSGMHDDFFIKRCVDGKAFKPINPEIIYYISHVDDVVESLIELKPLKIEAITLGQIYEQFGIGRRRIHRPTSIS